MDVTALEKLARLIRYFILTSTTQAGSGHATSSLSAVELATVLFFKYLRADLDNPANCANDRFILSKGHASPLLYSLYAAAGKVSEPDLLKLRTFDSSLEGHPSMRFPFTEIPTGSLGQGLSVGAGEALALREKFVRHKNVPNTPKIYVLMGDGEMAEGQVWEAIQCAAYHKLNNLIALIDVNRLGQSQATQYGHDIHAYGRRIASFGWRVYLVENGHDLELVDKSFSLALEQGGTSETPAAIIGRTIKGKGVSLFEDKEGWHGTPLTKAELVKALGELGDVDREFRGIVQKPATESVGAAAPSLSPSDNPEESGGGVAVSGTTRHLSLSYSEPVATRQAFGNALVRLGKLYPQMVVLDGDVQNSTYTSLFADQFPDRFYQMFIAEGNLVSAALGMAKMGWLPVVSTFGCFLARTADQLRLAALSGLHLVVNGSHAGVSVGADGPSQMGLEDIALFRALPNSVIVYPSEGWAAERLVEELLNLDKGIGYIRTTRPATPVIYSEDDVFPLGGSKVFAGRDEKVTVVAAGIILHEALKAQKQLGEQGIGIRVIDCYSIKPIDVGALKQAASETKAVIVVEDHYPEGGLGEEVKSVLADEPKVPIIHLSVSKVPRSGTPEELLRYEGIDAEGIIKAIEPWR